MSVPDTDLLGQPLTEMEEQSPGSTLRTVGNNMTPEQ